MLALIIYVLVLFLELIFLTGFTLYVIFLIYSSLKGSPYVPTSAKQTKLILEKADLKKNQTFLELGCGDGRVVMMAVKKYQVKGIGVEINPLLLNWNKFMVRIHKIKNINFLRFDITKQDYPKANVIYIFLMPKLIEKITPQLTKEIKQGTQIISHGFKVEGLTKYLKYKINENPFPTYFYKLRV